MASLSLTKVPARSTLSLSKPYLPPVTALTLRKIPRSSTLSLVKRPVR